MQVKFTDEVLEQLSCPEGKEYMEYTDPDKPGLILRVNSGGAKRWAIRVRLTEGKMQIKKNMYSIYNGKRLVKVKQVWSDAQKYIGQYKNGKTPLDPVKSAPKGPTLQDVYTAWQKAKIQRKSTKEAYNMLAMLHATKITAINDDAIKRYQITETARGMLPSTVNRRLTDLRYLIRWALEAGLVPAGYSVPSVKKLSEISIEPKIQQFTDSERVALIDAALQVSKITYHAGGRVLNMGYIYPLIVVALNTGMRPVQLLGMEWRDIDFTSGRELITSRHVNNRKASATARLPINNTTIAVLKAWQQLNHNAAPTDKVFGERKSFKGVFFHILKIAGLADKGYHPYTMRHDFAMRMIANGADATEVAYAMTHADPRTTRNYIDANEARQRAAIQRLDDK